MKVLVVEDNEDSRNLLVKQLHAYGHEVMAAANGAEALEQALAQPPDIIVSDILMPKMDGYQLCRECKQNDKLKDIPFVFYTATYTLDEDKKFALSLGADAFILKPTEPDAFLKMLSEIIEKAKSGTLAPPKAPLEPSLFLTEYNKRIVAKLEEKMAQLEESEKKYSTLVEQGNDGIIVIQDGLLKFVNSRMVEMSGFSLEEVVDKSFVDFVSPEYRELVVDRYKKRMSGEEIPNRYEIEILAKDGRKMPVEINASRVEYEGRPADMAIIRDITERKRVEERLRESEERYRNTLDHMLEGCQIIGYDWRYLYVNDAVVRHGRQAKEALLGHTMMEMYPGIENTEMFAALQRCMKKRIPHRMENEFTFLNGAKGYFDLSIQPVPDGVFILSLDITERKRAEEKIQESEERYRVLFSSGNDAIFVHRLTTGGIIGKFIEVNDVACQRLGYSREELLALPVVDIIAPENLKDAPAIVAKLLADKHVLFETVHLAKDGRRIPVEINTRLFELNGQSTVLSIARDITERKRADEALRESEEKYRTLVDNALVGVYRTNLKGDILYMNDTMASMFGFDSTEEMMAGGVVITYKNKKDRAILIEELKKRGTVSNFEVELLTKTKEIKNVVLSVVLEGDTLSGMLLDITEHKRADERIKHAAEEWRTTFDSITDLVSICSKDFKIVRVNKAFANAFKMKPQEVIGKPCYTLVHGTNEPVPNCPYKQTLEDEKPHIAEYFEPHLGIHLEESISPIFNEKGDVVACVHVIRDITERKRMEEQLIVTDRMASIGELASGIAHELNNPLTSIIGFAQLLLGKDVADDVKEDVKIIYSEAQRTAEVVKGLLTFARKHPPVKQLVNINSIIEKVLELRAYEQRVNNIQVNTRFATDLPEIMADYFQLQQVFLNIIINAEYFMIESHNGGTLTITTKRVGDIIRASFADDGPGISEDNIGHLFDPFFTTKEVGKGTGLGLSICHGIITEHGGRIYAESKLGKGAIFIVELPITIDKKGTVK